MEITAANKIEFQTANHNTWWSDLVVSVDDLDMSNLKYLSGNLTINNKGFTAPNLETVTGSVSINTDVTIPELDLSRLMIITKDLNVNCSTNPVSLPSLYQVLGIFSKNANSELTTPNLSVIGTKINKLANFKPGQIAA